MSDFLRQLGAERRDPPTPGGGRLVQSFWTDVINSHDPSAARDLMTDDYVQHTPGIAQGPDGFRAFLTQLLAESTGMRADVTGLPEIDDLVVSATTVEFDTPPPGWSTPTQLVDVFRIRGDRLCEHWDLTVTADPSTPS